MNKQKQLNFSQFTIKLTAIVEKEDSLFLRLGYDNIYIDGWEFTSETVNDILDLLSRYKKCDWKIEPSTYYQGGIMFNILLLEYENCMQKHPDPKIQMQQEVYLEKLPESERDFHARMLRIGNVSYRYHNLVDLTNDKELKLYHHHWLQTFPDDIRENMEKEGFEKSKLSLSFTRYVLEKNNVSMDEWMKQHLSEDDYKVFIEEQQ